MVQKLQDLESQHDALQLELKRKAGHLNMLQREREQHANQIKVADENHSKEKQVLVEVMIELKRKKEQKDRQISAKEMELLHAKQALEQQQMNLSNREQAILILLAKVKQRSEQQNAVELQLSAKRREFLKLQSTIHETEEKIFKKTASMQEQITHELRSEISLLHQQMREKELLAEQDRLLRNKMMDDSAVLTQENATLQSRLLELTKQLDIERALKEESCASHSASIAQLLTVKDNEEHLQQEIKRHQELLEKKKCTFQDLENQVSILEKGSTSSELNIATINSRVAEMKFILDKEEQDNLELKRDKALLVDFIASLQKQLSGKEKNLLQTSNKMLQLDEALSALKTKHELRQSLQSEKWKEISQMANSMRKLNKSMTDIVVNMGKY